MAKFRYVGPIERGEVKFYGGLKTKNGVVECPELYLEKARRNPDFEEINSPVVPAADPPSAGLSSMTVKELKALAESAGVDVTGLKKAQIVEALESQPEE